MDAIDQAQSKISATKAALVDEIQAIKSRLGTAKQVHTDKDDQIITLKLEIKHLVKELQTYLDELQACWKSLLKS